MSNHSRTQDVRQARTTLHYAVGAVARANLVVLAYRWRHEVAVVGAVASPWLMLRPPAAAAITAGLAAAFGLLSCWPPGRRFLLARFWCIVTPHRVRIACEQCWIHSRDGKIPVVLITRHKPFGERVHLWCRAGTSVFDLESARDLLAAACWSQDVEVTCSTRYPHLVALDVIRRGSSVANSHPTGTSQIDGGLDVAERGAFT